MMLQFSCVWTHQEWYFWWLLLLYLNTHRIKQSFCPSVLPSDVTCNQKHHEIHITSNVNNSGIFYHKMLPKVANERFCNIFFIFGVVWEYWGKGQPSPLKNKFYPTSNLNNSGIFYGKKLPKVANERFCNIFFIFWVVWGKGVAPKGVLKKTKNNENCQKTKNFEGQ